MKKRLLTAFLAVAMLVTSMPAALAAKKPVAEDAGAGAANGENVYTWADFENPASLDMIDLPADRADKKSIVRGGANGSKYALFIDSLSSAQPYPPKFWFPAVPGETYTFSFWFKGHKSNHPSMSTIYPIFIPSGGSWLYLSSYSVKEVYDWKLYSITWTCPEKAANGKELVNGVGGYIQFRGGRTDTGRRIGFYLDEISLIPHGNKSGIDYSWVNDGYVPDDFTLPDTTADAIDTEDVNFTDVTGHWAETIIEDLAKYGYVNGVGNNQYSPNSSLTRAQFIKMVADLYEMETPEYDGRFKDVAGDEWFAAPLVIADDLGLIDVAMKLGGNIKPNAPITREEAASIAAKVAKERGAKEDFKNSTTFADSASITEWAKAGVKNAALYGLIKGYEDGTYKPARGLTRAEAAQILFRIVEIKSKMHIYVDAQTGDDLKGDGSQANPYGSIDKARMVARQYAPTMENDLKIMLRGKFKLTDTLKLGPEDSGANGYSIIYTSWGEEKPVITRAEEFSDFELHDAENNIWKTYVGNNYSRHAYFNDVRGIRARTNGRLTNEKYMESSYFLVDDEWLLDIRYPNELEFVTAILWTQQTYRIDSITKQEDGRIRIQPNIYFPENNYYHDFHANTEDADMAMPMYLENAYEFLDNKGEWYLNKHDGYLYYIPRTGEDMSNMTVKLPTGEYLIEAKGYGSTDPVANLTFENIMFEGTTYLKVEREGGFSDQQNVEFFLNDDVVDFDSYNQPWKSQNPKAAVDFAFCYNINFYENTFRQLGTIAVTFREGSRHVDFIGNEIYDTAGGGINIDTIAFDGSTRPEDTYTEYVRVNNNYIHHTCFEWADAAAISFVWPRHSEFNHNEVHTLPYSGFHIGWGWQSYAATGTPMFDVEVNNNYVHDTFLGNIHDGGSIYTLGASSLECDKTNTELNNKMYGNYVVNSWCGQIYPDEGSTSWHIKDNVIDSSRVKYIESHLHPNKPAGTEKKPWAMHMHAGSIMWITTENIYATSDYAYEYGWMNMQESVIDPIKRIEPGKWEEWPQEAKDIMANAGIEPEYRHLFKGLDGAKGMICDDRRQNLPLETPTFSGITIVGGPDNSYSFPLEDYEIDVHTADPEALTLTKDGYWIAHKKGIIEAHVVTRINGITQIMHVKLFAGNEVESVALNATSMKVVVGQHGDYKINAVYTFGNTDDVTLRADFDIKPDDPIVKIERATNGSQDVIRVTPITEEKGKTTLRGTISFGGMTANVEIPVEVITYGSKDALNLPATHYNMGSGWRDAPKKVGENGYKVSGSPNPGLRVNNQLFAFDMMCEPGSDWPTIGICDSDRMGNYNSNDLYMIGFKEDLIELQKFNKGVRTMFFGPANLNPISGPGIPTTREDGSKLFEYGKRYSVVIGALDVEGGTRIILTINGENIIDYVDETHNAIPASGGIVVYNPASSSQQGLYEEGGFTFWPYTGIVNEEKEEK